MTAVFQKCYPSSFSATRLQLMSTMNVVVMMLEFVLNLHLGFQRFTEKRTHTKQPVSEQAVGACWKFSNINIKHYFYMDRFKCLSRIHTSTVRDQTQANLCVVCTHSRETEGGLVLSCGTFTIWPNLKLEQCTVCVQRTCFPSHCSSRASVSLPLSDGSDQVRKAALQLRSPCLLTKQNLSRKKKR